VVFWPWWWCCWRMKCINRKRRLRSHRLTGQLCTAAWFFAMVVAAAPASYRKSTNSKANLPTPVFWQ
jgi:hypothetical protein